MKRALIVIASVGILAVPVAVESANAQVNKPPGAFFGAFPGPAYGAYPWPAYPPQSLGLVRRGVPRTNPFSNTAPFFNPNSPAVTGGGSLGYNQNLWKW